MFAPPAPSRLRTMLSVCALILTPFTLRAELIYSHVFDGSASDGLNSTALDVGGVNWTASSTSKANGTDSAQSTAWVPYAFGTGIYTVTLTLDVSALASNSSGLFGIGFTNNTAFNTGDFTASTNNTYASIGLRGSSVWDFWGGKGNANSVDGGSTVFPRQNTLKLVLDTTKANWEVTASILNTNGVETWLDLSPGDSSGIAYTYATNPAAFTGVGILMRSSDGQAVEFTFSAEPSLVPEPASAATLLGLGALAFVARRRRRS